MSKEAYNFSSAAIDRVAALSRLGGDEILYREMACLFIDDTPQLLTDLEEAAQSGATAEVQRLAHSLRGLAANFGADSCMSAAMLVETAGKTGNLSHLSRRLAALRQEVSRVINSLRLELER